MFFIILEKESQAISSALMTVLQSVFLKSSQNLALSNFLKDLDFINLGLLDRFFATFLTVTSMSWSLIPDLKTSEKEMCRLLEKITSICVEDDGVILVGLLIQLFRLSLNEFFNYSSKS